MEIPLLDEAAICLCGALGKVKKEQDLHALAQLILVQWDFSSGDHVL